MKSEPLVRDWGEHKVSDDDDGRWSATDGTSSVTDPATEQHEFQELWEVQLDEKLVAHFERRGSGFRLLSLGELAGELQLHFRRHLDAAGISGDLIAPAPDRRRGILEYGRLRWLNSNFFRVPQEAAVTSSVIAFKQSGLPKCPPWREYVFQAGASTSEFHYDELAAVYDLLGLLAQRRSLVSVTAQRILRKIVLPWGRCRLHLSEGVPSKEYLLVPVLTMISRRMSSEFRRTITLTTFLLPNDADARPALGTKDLAALCQQAVWHDTGPALPVLARSSDAAELFAGPLAAYLRQEMDQSTRLPDIFDAIFRQALHTLGIRPTTHYPSESVRSLIAISRARSVVFGSVMHTVNEDHKAPLDIFKAKRNRDRDLASELEKLLSVNAGREGREPLLGGRGFRVEQMRVTNPYEEDTRTSVLYNPMSRFIVQLIPRSIERFPTISLKFGVVWLNLLASTVSNVKEMLRSYRYEIERYRNRLDPKTPEDSQRLLKDIHNTTRRILEEVDVVSSFDLVTPTYKAAHAQILEMEGVFQEREYLMREIEVTTGLLRSEEANNQTRAIALNTNRTDELTAFVALFSSLSAMLVANVLVDFWYHDLHEAFWKMAWVDGAILIALVALVVYSWRRRRSG